MSANETATDTVRDQAARWVARLHDTDLSDTEREQLHLWLLADPRHASEFRVHNAILGMARELPPDLYARLSAFAPANPDSPLQSGRRRWMGMSALAAALLITLSAGGWLFLNGDQVLSHTY